ncbi:MAG: HAMP domain-containing protein [Chloroflexi bacterium]|nr:HAMP domain-containing protein [Chloroflexota bacterium]
MVNPTSHSPSTERSPRQRSLRTRLVQGNMLITILAISGLGLYIFLRSREANTYLTTQLGESIYQQAQDNLASASNQHTLQLDAFFHTMRRDISNLGASIGSLLSEPGTSSGIYWDAAASLTRMENGSWDNPNSETASVFIPAVVELTSPLVAVLNSVRQTDFFAPPLLEANPDIVAIYFGGVYGETVYYPNIDLAAIVPADFDVTSRPWYANAGDENNPDRVSVWTDPYLDAALNGLVITISMPVYDSNGRFRGVTAMDIQLNRITEIVTNIQVDGVGYAFLLDSDNRLIAMPASGYQDLGISPDLLPLGEFLTQSQATAATPPEFWDLIASLATGGSGLETLTIGGTERFIIYEPVPAIGYGLAIVVPSEALLADAVAANQEVSRVIQNTLLYGVIIIAAVLVAALLASLGFSNRLTRPLAALTHVAGEIARGNLAAEAVITTRDEIGTLANAFNSMTTRLRETIANLEERVAERTQALERRALQVQAAAEVGSAAASMRNLEELLTRATHLISQRFGFYHVGIFLLDEREEFAVLRAANSSGGQAMLARSHKLQVGQVGIVGHVTSSGNARIALDVGEDAVFFDNPDLPETRSEMAVPLRIGNQTIGALDVQSKQEGAFTDEDLQTLRLLADQLATAINNARLFAESKAAIETTQRAYGDISRAQWQELFKDKKRQLGFTLLPTGRFLPVSGETGGEFEQSMSSSIPVISADGTTVHLPIQVMGHAIGALRLARGDGKRWADEDLADISILAGQLGTALENARLYEQITDRARHEALIAEITASISASFEMDKIMSTTVEEIGRIFTDAEVILQLKKESGK